MEQIVSILPLSQRAKNRVREHGTTFRVRGTGTTGTEAHSDQVLLVSMDGEWFGWFEIGKEIKILQWVED